MSTTRRTRARRRRGASGRTAGRAPSSALFAAPRAAPAAAARQTGPSSASRQRRHADQPGAGVGADHGPDLRDELGRRGRRSPRRARASFSAWSARLDVLDEEAVVAVLAQRAQVVDQALERAAPGAHALDGHDLGLDREDRLDLQRRADPRLRAADPAAAAQELERVDGEEDLQLLAQRARARAAASAASAPAAAALAAAIAEQPEAGAARVAESTITIRAGVDAALDELRRAPARPSGRCRRCRPRGGSRRCRRRARAAARRRRGSRRPTAARCVGSSRAAAQVRRRRRRSRAGRPRGRRAAARPSDVQRDGVEPVALGDLARQVVRGVGDDGDLAMARHPSRPERIASASCSTAAARRRTGCARAGASPGRCARAAIEVEERRVPWRRGERDEVDALTGQRVVPVLVLGARGDLRLARGSSSTCAARAPSTERQFASYASRTVAASSVGWTTDLRAGRRRLGQRVRQLVEADRARRERAPVDRAAGEQRQRAVDLGRGVVERAAEVELVVVQRAASAARRLPAAQPPTKTTQPPARTPRPRRARRPGARPPRRRRRGRRAARRVIAPSASACARRSGWRSASVTVRPSATSSAASIWPIGPPPSTPASGASAPRRRARDRVHARPRAARPSPRRPARARPARRAAPPPARRSAPRSRRAPSAARGRSAAARRARPARAARDRVADQHPLAGVGAHAGRLVAEARRVRRAGSGARGATSSRRSRTSSRASTRTSTSPGAGAGLGDVLDAQVARARAGTAARLTAARPP